MKKKLAKSERQQVLQKTLAENPFLTDRELADIFEVSIQTIRLDRLELDIPEVRKRMKNLAKRAYSKVKSVSDCEIVGELVDVNLNKSGVSILETSEDMALEKSQIVRGHHIFAHANTLAIAILDIDLALTASTKTKFIKPVYAGSRLVAQATVNTIKGDTFQIEVKTKVKEGRVFEGIFTIFAGQVLS
ncbi:transcription factor FapR [Fuchsiella alkaliacetigena]|uniref:transcription factor FapR n=1 Tax=Fuchsiella alkaliacetigena TaxID=957042 RepID=UPI00200ABBF1|nr:transcription factor FapR [Fuchsiella alkaliacetigena]MCK8823955.1 transcription factor FapR [Fuchsiella alkaliacetigena]